MNYYLNFLNELNEKQREAVLYNEGNLLVLAPAGSGKTKVLTYKIVYLLIEKKISPQNILALTFTNKAAKEMRERVLDILNLKIDISKRSSLTISTFHSFFYKILKENIDLIGFKKNFSIYDENESQELIKKIIEEENIELFDYNIREVYSIISKYKNSYFKIELKSKNIKLIYDKYQQYLKSYNVMDFDDILVYFFNLLNNNKDFFEKISRRFKYILIDEYQDTNILQYNIIKKMCENGAILTCVGDDDQSIYGFRGANYQNVFFLENDFKDLKTIILDTNYRSSNIIIDASLSVINKNRNRKAKSIKSIKYSEEKIVIFESENPQNEAKFVYDIVYENLYKNGIKYKNIAVLYRNNYQSKPIEDLFKFKGVPYKIYGSKSFYDREEIKDILSYLFFLVNPFDEISLLRIINVPKRGIGIKLVEKLNKISKENNLSLIQILRLTEENKRVFDLEENEVIKIYDFYKTIKNYFEKILNLKNIYNVLKELIEDINYIDYLKSRYEEKVFKYKLFNIETLLSSIFISSNNNDYDYEIKTIYDLINKLKFLSSYESNYNDLNKDNEIDDYVNLLTMHSAKGLEFKVVIIVGVEEEIIPSINSINESEIEEERRLFYVAMTRAKEKLYISYNKKRIRYKEEIICEPSEFISYIPEKLIKYDLSDHSPKVSAEDFSKLKNIIK